MNIAESMRTILVLGPGICMARVRLKDSREPCSLDGGEELGEETSYNGVDFQE